MLGDFAWDLEYAYEKPNREKKSTVTSWANWPETQELTAFAPEGQCWKPFFGNLSAQSWCPDGRGIYGSPKSSVSIKPHERNRWKTGSRERSEEVPYRIRASDDLKESDYIHEIEHLHIRYVMLTFCPPVQCAEPSFLRWKIAPPLRL